MAEDTLETYQVSHLERAKVRLRPLFMLPRGKNILADLYLRTAVIQEIIGTPTPRRHAKYFEDQLREAEKSSQSEDFNVLLLGAMSPSSVLDVLEIIKSSGVKNPALTVIDISRAPLAAAKTDLERIADKMGIRLNLVQADLRKLSFRENYFNLILGDQVYNFLSPDGWVDATKHIMNFVAPGGRFVNIISTYQKLIPFFGGWSQRLIGEQRSISPQNCDVEELRRPANPREFWVGAYMDQTAVTISKPLEAPVAAK